MSLENLSFSASFFPIDGCLGTGSARTSGDSFFPNGQPSKAEVPGSYPSFSILSQKRVIFSFSFSFLFYLDLHLGQIPSFLNHVEGGDPSAGRHPPFPDQ